MVDMLWCLEFTFGQTTLDFRESFKQALVLTIQLISPKKGEGFVGSGVWHLVNRRETQSERTRSKAILPVLDLLRLYGLDQWRVRLLSKEKSVQRMTGMEPLVVVLSK